MSTTPIVIDQRERSADASEVMRMALDTLSARIWTCMPGIVQTFNAALQTATVMIPIQMNVYDPIAGTTKWVNLPILLDCPVIFPSGGGHTLTFPVSQGDECMVQFADRCIDSWWQLGAGPGGVTARPQAEFRMHDLSDGIVLVGMRSNPRALSNVSTTSTQLRSDDGATIIDLNGAAHQITLVALGQVVMESPVVSTTGNFVAGNGASGSFTTPTGQIVSVQNGIIINIK